MIPEQMVTLFTFTFMQYCPPIKHRNLHWQVAMLAYSESDDSQTILSFDHTTQNETNIIDAPISDSVSKTASCLNDWSNKGNQILHRRPSVSSTVYPVRMQVTWCYYMVLILLHVLLKEEKMGNKKKKKMYASCRSCMLSHFSNANLRNF